MQESSAYQKIFTDGEINALRKTLLFQGNQKFGHATAAAQGRIMATKDAERLERMTQRLLLVSDWEELLDTP